MAKKTFKQIIPLLRVLERASPQSRSVLFKHLSPKDSLTICDCISEVLTTNKFSPETKARIKSLLREKKKVLRFIGNKRNSPLARRKQLPCVGGFWGLVLRLAIPLVVSVVSEALKKKAST